jgi:hypothetical protein
LLGILLKPFKIKQQYKRKGVELFFPPPPPPPQWPVIYFLGLWWFINPFITGIGSLNPLLGVKIVHLVDRTDLFKVSNLLYDGREIVRSLYSSLQGQTVYGGYSELAGSLFVSVKIVGLGNFLEQLT